MKHPRPAPTLTTKQQRSKVPSARQVPKERCLGWWTTNMVYLSTGYPALLAVENPLRAFVSSGLEDKGGRSKRSKPSATWPKLVAPQVTRA
eukprot:scaffold1223_cov136-Isochrysis_galbana.AAC.11